MMNSFKVTPAIQIEKTDGHELLCNILILHDGLRDDESPFQVIIIFDSFPQQFDKKRSSYATIFVSYFDKFASKNASKCFVFLRKRTDMSCSATF